MNRSLVIFLILMSIGSAIMAQVPVPARGSIRRLANFPSSYIQPRNVDVWLPDGYTAKEKYAVLYMHDGQMLYDSSITWNKQEWQVDETIADLLERKRIRKVIVVGVWNNGAYRHAEYFPEKPLNNLPQVIKDTLVKNELKGHPLADNYLRFLVKELKPFIDSTFSTKPDQKNTFVAGSSMGGLISLYAICEYPGVFGGAACLSTHWPGSLQQREGIIPAAFNQYLKEHLPSPKDHRIYFDYGTKTLDSLYKPYQLTVNGIMKDKGYKDSNWNTWEFVGEDHSEKAWAKRLFRPLIFLLKK